MCTLVMLMGCGGATTFIEQPPPAPPAPVVHEPPKPVVVSVLGTSDVHGHIERVAVFGGYVDKVRELRANDGGVIVVDAGDAFQGTLVANETEGAAMIRAYNALGYSAFALGNHEFDYGPVGPQATPKSASDDPRGALLAAVRIAKFPVLAANIEDKAASKPVDWPNVIPSAITQVRDIKVGIVGVQGAGSLSQTIAGNVSDLKLSPPAEAIMREAKALRDKGAHVVVAVAHEGGDCSSFDNPDDTSSCADEHIMQMAQALDPKMVNVLVGGHTHRAMAHRVNGIAVIQSYAYGQAFGRVDLQVDPATGNTVVLRIFPPQQLCANSEDSTPLCTPGSYEGQPIEPSKQVLEAIATDVKQARAKAEEPIGAVLPKPLPHGRSPLDSEAATQVAAWMLQARPKGQMAIINTAGIRSDLNAGPMSYGAFYEMFPFDNRFAIGTVKVEYVRKLLRDSFARGSGHSIAGVTVKATCKGSELNIELIRNGRRLDDKDSITLVASDYLATTPRFASAGLVPDSFTIEDDPTIRDAIVGVLKDKGTLSLVKESPLHLPSWPVKCGAPEPAKSK